MNKYLILIFVFVYTLSTTVFAFAQTPTSTSSAIPTDEENQDQIERIKDIVASRVAELKLVEKRGILGLVESGTNTKIILMDEKNNRRIIDIDEITEFNDPDNSKFGISDVKEGNALGIIGLLNKGTDHILARFINVVDSVPTRIEGAIKNIEKKDFVVTIVDEKGTERKIYIETSTKVSVFDSENNFIKSGFSKLNIGERVFVSGFIDSKDKLLLNASRFIHFTTLPPSKDTTRSLDKIP